LSLLIQFYYPELVEQNGFQYTFDIMYEKWDFLYLELNLPKKCLGKNNGFREFLILYLTDIQLIF
jgi:hypothetical protein